MAFQVGDRVRCIDAGANVNIRTGREYTVLGADRGHIKVDNGQDTPYHNFRFELVVDAPLQPADNRQSITLYTVVYSYEGHVRSRGFNTEDALDRYMRNVVDISPNIGVLAKKKITVRI